MTRLDYTLSDSSNNLIVKHVMPLSRVIQLSWLFYEPVLPHLPYNITNSIDTLMHQVNLSMIKNDINYCKLSDYVSTQRISDLQSLSDSYSERTSTVTEMRPTKYTGYYKRRILFHKGGD